MPKETLVSLVADVLGRVIFPRPSPIRLSKIDAYDQDFGGTIQHRPTTGKRDTSVLFESTL